MVVSLEPGMGSSRDLSREHRAIWKIFYISGCCRL